MRAKKPVKAAPKKSARRAAPVANPAAPPAPVEAPITAPHKWTHDGSRVLLLKCVGADRQSFNGFVWPESGPVTPTNWSRTPDCESGGLFGWPWGLGRGGKEPEYRESKWIVFAAHPDDVIGIEEAGCIDKAKAVPNPELGRAPEVLYCGDYAGALRLILPGQVGWIQHSASGAASATGWSGAASATGESGAASATGERGAASATGWRGAASATGERGAASATGGSGAASATGESGAASATGWRGAASATGGSGAASATGWSGAASATGESGAASATGWRGAASATGESGAASATGGRGAASATGGRGIAAVTGEYAVVEAGPDDVAVATCEDVKWIVRVGALFLQRWPGGHVLLTAADLQAKDGDRVRIVRGQKVDHVKASA